MRSDPLLADYLISDLWTYVSSGMRMKLYDEPHREMTTFFEEALPPPPDEMHAAEQKFRAFAAPRETLKTSIGVQGLAEYFLYRFKRLYNYDGRVLIVRASREAAEGVLLAIKEDVSGVNPVLLKAFGDMSVDTSKWGASSIIYGNRSISYRDPTIDTAGMGMSKTGGHYDLILLDDLCNENNYLSEEIMMQARRYIQACMPILNAWGSMVHIGTRWSNLDTTGWILERNEEAAKEGLPKPWVTMIRSAYTSDGGLYYPSFLNEKRLAKKRAGMDDKLFSSQYLNQIVAEDSQVFRPEWLRFYDGHYDPDSDTIAMLTIDNDDTQMPRYAGAQLPVSAAVVIDPAATTTNQSNSTGMALILCDPEGVMWVHECWKGRQAPSDILDRIVAWCVTYRPRRLSIDTLGQQVLWIDPIQRLLREAGVVGTQVMMHKGRAVRFNGQEMKSTTGILSKASRIEALQPFFREGKIMLRRGHCQPIVHEYTYYTGPTAREHYDMLDALAQAPVVCIRPQPEVFSDDIEAREMREEMEDAPQDEQENVKGIYTGREKRSVAVV